MLSKVNMCVSENFSYLLFLYLELPFVNIKNTEKYVNKFILEEKAFI